MEEHELPKSIAVLTEEIPTLTIEESYNFNGLEAWIRRDGNIALYDALRRKGIPTEIILLILENSSRWILTYSHSVRTAGFRYRKFGIYNFFDNSIISASTHSLFLRSQALSSREAKGVRRITFEFRGEWCPAGLHLIRQEPRWYKIFARTTPGSDWRVENHRFDLQWWEISPDRRFVNYRVGLGKGHPLVKDLKEGACIELGVIPCWFFHLVELKIQVWCVEDVAMSESLKWVERENSEARRFYRDGRWSSARSCLRRQ